MLKRARSHFVHNAVAYLALFIAFSGTAYAGAKFTGADIVDESLTGADVLNGSVTGADVGNESLTGADVLNGSLTGSDTGIAAAFGSNNADDPLPHVAQVLASANVAVARTSTLVVFGHSDGLVICQEPAPDATLCQTKVGLYLDGSPIPASAGQAQGLFPGEGNSFDEITLFATVPNVAAGVHTVSIGVGTADGDSVQVGFLGERVAAIAIPE